MTLKLTTNTHILITGGTGFIGKALCTVLIQSGCKVVVLTRSKQRALEHAASQIEFIENLDQLDENAHFDVVINLAGEPIAQRWTHEAQARILESRLNTTKDLIIFFKRAKHKPDLLINGSAIGWYGTHRSDTFDESSVPSNDVIGKFSKEVCHKWEAEALKVRALGIRTVILRTGIVLEKGGGTLAQLIPPFNLGLGGPMGSGNQWFSWIHRDDLIGLIFHAIDNENIEGVINGTAPEPVTNKVFSKALGKAMKRPAFIPLPVFVLKTIFGQMADEIMLNGQKVLPKKSEENGYIFKYAKIDLALEDIFKA